jgi:SsrA-binding protein
MHRREINRLYGRLKQEGLALIPLSVYLKNSLVKIELGLCKGKKLHDKREAAAKRDAGREIQKSLKERN